MAVSKLANLFPLAAQSGLNSQWHGSCSHFLVKLSLVTGSSMGEGEIQRQRELREQSRHAHRAQFWADVRHALVDGVRAIFILLLGTAILVFVVSHRTEISSIATKKISRVATHLQSPANSGALAQGTLNYEKEVEDASK